ncbi:MAG: DUF2958 domain-containing protein, partial [Anaerolineae bacterium]|nr:DUF2958 domain-containing protein [Anaerolineae bacterium]
MSPNADFSLGDTALFYVTCPQCQSRVELPDYDAESNQTVICDNCGLAFSYSDPEVRHVAHDLMPEKIAQHIPPLYATEHQDDPLALLKWFTPDSSWTWYITEYDPQERLCFGVVIGHERE